MYYVTIIIKPLIMLQKRMINPITARNYNKLHNCNYTVYLLYILGKRKKMVKGKFILKGRKYLLKQNNYMAL